MDKNKNFRNLYIKYKNKYINLNEKLGGSFLKKLNKLKKDKKLEIKFVPRDEFYFQDSNTLSNCNNANDYECIVLFNSHFNHTEKINSTSSLNDIIGLFFNNNYYQSTNEIISSNQFGKEFKFTNIIKTNLDYFIFHQVENQYFYYYKINSFILSQLQRGKIDKLPIVPSYSYEFNEEGYIIYPSSQGKLVDILNKIKNTIDIFKQITNNVKLLYDLGIYYLGISSDNIFYNTTDNVNFNFEFGNKIYFAFKDSMNIFDYIDVLNKEIKIEHFDNNLYLLLFKHGQFYNELGYFRVDEDEKQKYELLLNLPLRIIDLLTKLKIIKISYYDKSNNLVIETLRFPKVEPNNYFSYHQLHQYPFLNIENTFYDNIFEKNNIFMNHIFYALGILLIELILQKRISNNGFIRNFIAEKQRIINLINSSKIKNKKNIIDLLFGVNGFIQNNIYQMNETKVIEYFNKINILGI
jgi:hypothetical protein